MIVKVIFILVVLEQNSNIVHSKFSKSTNDDEQKCVFEYFEGDFEEFESTIHEIRKCAKGFREPNLEIKLEDYFLPAFPNGTFTDIGEIKTFTLYASNSRLPLLSPMIPGYHVFEYLRFKTAKFDVWDVSTLNGWRWEDLSFTGNEEIEKFEFNMVRSSLIYLAPSFGKVANGRLTCLRILKCRLKWLGKTVFSPFSHLVSLELRDNLIEEIERSHLPKKASKLSVLDLGNNRIKSLPADFFEDLHLTNLLLKGNRIKIIDNHLEAISKNKIPVSIIGAIWPCKCSDISKIIQKKPLDEDHLKYEKCYVDESVKNLANYIKRCN